MLEIYKLYQTPEMGRAIHTLWNSPPEKFQPNTDEDHQRRMVSDFWNWLGWMLDEGLVDVDLIHRRFQNGVLVWEKLEPIELAIRKRIERRDHAGWDDEKINKAARQHVGNQPAAKLYVKWKQRYGHQQGLN